VTLVIGLVLGLVIGLLIATSRRSNPLLSTSQVYPAIEHIADLVRRSHDASLVCLVRTNREPLMVGSDTDMPDDVVKRAMSAGRLAMADGREHVFPGQFTIVARGNGDTGLALVIPTQHVSADMARRISSDLRRVLDHVPVGPRPSGPHRIEPLRGRDLASSVDTLAGVAFGMSERARTISGQPAAVVLRDEASETARVIAVSRGVDRHLIGSPVAPDSATGRACIGDAPVIAKEPEELFGRIPGDRRQRRSQGTAYPLRDGRSGVGALVVLGPHDDVDDHVWEQIMWLSVDSGPQFAAAAAVKRAEDRAKTDVLTALPNRTALQEAMAGDAASPCSILCVDIDYFKRLNDAHGHAAGDAALKHIARIFRRSLRARDLPARVGGEEFALWLPETDQPTALEVAERVRKTVEDASFEWAGSEVPMTCSIGVASCPETATQVANLLPTADAALYRAKRGGRNRVEAAVGAGVSS